MGGQSRAPPTCAHGGHKYAHGVKFGDFWSDLGKNVVFGCVSGVFRFFLVGLVRMEVARGVVWRGFWGVIERKWGVIRGY